MKYFENPWFDPRNELSPAHFRTPDEPVESHDVIDFYEVLSDHQCPSVLAVVNSKRAGDTAGDRVVGQYVTVKGGKRALGLFESEQDRLLNRKTELANMDELGNEEIFELREINARLKKLGF